MSIFETTHTIIRVNDDKGINMHNQVYIPMRRVKKLKSIKARTIAKDGKITNLDENNIKQIENVEEYGNFQIFAIEGAENGSEIEVMYTVEKVYSPFGTENLQFDYPVKRSEMVFISNGLISNLKTYNTNQNFERTYLDNLLVEELVLNDIPSTSQEDYAAKDAYKIYVAYQCFGNSELTQEVLWNNTVENIGGNFFPTAIPKVVIDEIRSNILKKDEKISDFEIA